MKIKLDHSDLFIVSAIEHCTAILDRYELLRNDLESTSTD